MTGSVLSLDFETRSAVDLVEVGVYNYAIHPTTDVWCLAYAFDDEPIELWTLGQPFPERIRQHVAAGGALRAWNANFERTIWRSLCVPKYGWPEPSREQWYCTMAEALAMGLPASLGFAAQALKLEQGKDWDGHNLMLRLCRPRKVDKKTGHITWWTDDDKLSALYAYCIQDVRTERLIAGKIRRLSERERKLYLLDQTINDRGIRVDVPMIEHATTIVARGLEEVNQRLTTITDGAVGSVTKAADLKRWLDEKGFDTPTVKKSAIRDMLTEELTDEVREALLLRQEGAKSSTAKLRSMLGHAHWQDNRMRGLLFYYGAGTGRWSGRGPQPHNFPRPELDPHDYIDLIRSGDYDTLSLLVPPLIAVSSALRATMVAAPGAKLFGGDYAAIEARVLAWLAGQDDLLELFRKGKKVYAEFAAAALHKQPTEITKGSIDYMMGKATVLGCGFGMGHEKFIAQAKETWGLELEPETAQFLVKSYRELYSAIVGFWYDLNDAVIEAVYHPGTVHVVRGKIKIVVRGGVLWVVLPVGRALAYHSPKIVQRKTPWGDVRDAVEVWGMDSYIKQYAPFVLYGGLLAENVTQAVARDVMADAMVRLEAEGWPVVLTVHDSIMCETTNPEATLGRFTALMKTVPEWAAGLPLDVEGWSGDRWLE